MDGLRVGSNVFFYQSCQMLRLYSVDGYVVVDGVIFVGD
jgi:hypothetical protein